MEHICIAKPDDVTIKRSIGLGWYVVKKAMLTVFWIRYCPYCGRDLRGEGE